MPVESNNEMVMHAQNAAITKIEIDKAKGEDTPVVLTLRIETGPVPLDQLDFMIPEGDPFHFWDNRGEVLENAPEQMHMAFKAKQAHDAQIDEVVDFIGHQFSGFKAVPTRNKHMTLSFAVKVIEPEQDLLVKLAQRVKSPIQFEVIGAIQMGLDL